MRSFRGLMQAGALLGGVALATLAFAAGTKSAALSEFASMDANKDGKVIRSENRGQARIILAICDAR